MNHLSEEDDALEATILELLGKRAEGATICPSDAARAVSPDDWRDWMEAARDAARRLVAQGRVTITQGGEAIDPTTIHGPIRIRLN